MAHIKYITQLEYISSLLIDLERSMYCVDVNISNREVYDALIDRGFDFRAWSERNFGNVIFCDE